MQAACRRAALRRGAASAWIPIVAVTAAIALVAACASGPPPSPVELGERALAAGDWRAARGHFAEALRADASDGRAWLGQARAQLRGREPEAALGSLARLARLDPARLREPDGRATHADVLEAAAQARLAASRSEPALAAVRALAKLAPDRRGLDRLLGRALVAEGTRRRLLGERDAALALYREACRVTPATLEAWVAAVELLIETGRGREARAVLEAARQVHPTAGAIRTLTLQTLGMR